MPYTFNFIFTFFFVLVRRVQNLIFVKLQSDTSVGLYDIEHNLFHNLAKLISRAPFLNTVTTELWTEHRELNLKLILRASHLCKIYLITHTRVDNLQ
jgi:hypothetical protein